MKHNWKDLKDLRLKECETLGRGLVVTSAVLGELLDLMILEGFSSLNDSIECRART